MSSVSVSSPRVSIILAVYNGGRTLPAALASLHQQTWSNFEIIVIDDASSDSTPAILAQWQQYFSPQRFLIITNAQNSGLTLSLLRGLTKARGQYIARLDADDMWQPEKLAKQMAFLSQQPGYGMVGSWYVNKSLHTKKFVRLPTTDAQIRSRIFSNNPFGHSCILIRKDILDKAGSYDPAIRFGQDYDLWFRLLPLTKLANLPEFLVERSIEQSLSRRHSPEQLQQSLNTILKYARRYNVSGWHYRGALVVALLWRLSQLKRRFRSYFP